MKKFISLFLIFSLMMLSGNLYAKERRGAKLIIQRIGDQAKETGLEDTPWETSAMMGIRGELIAVKPNSLLLLDTEGKDVSIDIGDIKVIRIVKKSKIWQGVGIGFSIGASGGALLGATTDAGFDDDGRFSWILFWGVIFGVPCALIGGIFGALASIDKTIHLEGMTESEIQETLDKLRKKARIRDYK